MQESRYLLLVKKPDATWHTGHFCDLAQKSPALQHKPACTEGVGGCLLGTCLAASSLQDRQDDERADPPQQEEQVEQPEGNARIKQQEDARQERCAAQRRPRELFVLPPPLRGGKRRRRQGKSFTRFTRLRKEETGHMQKTRVRELVSLQQ